MSVAGTPSSDPWVILTRERARYEEQFRSLKPCNNIVTGDQAKGLFLQSQLSPAILGQIWGLADTDSDGKMDINEFSIACKLINLKLRGFEIPKVLPPSLVASLRTPPIAPIIPQLATPPTVPQAAIPPMPINSQIIGYVSGVPVATSPSMSPVLPTTSTPRSSVASLDAPQVEWSIPHQTKLKYTQIFNTSDRTRSGFLSGAQARNIMVQTKLPQNVLAQIWGLSDMDCDGRLGSEEFVLAMHLCEQASIGNLPPAKLPPDLIPPSFRRPTRTASVSSQGSAAPMEDPASTLLQTSFEDKRKENFEKGQAELERRRKALLDQQRKEAEERERKEREELERREKARLEAERKRMEELEQQMRAQQEQERQKEEERKRQAEQREAARKEMERQRQLEWEKQRLQELQLQRQREQESVLKLKAKSSTLTIELTGLNEQIKELSQKICDTRLGVSNVKTTIDGMRTTRDSQVKEMSQLKNQLKEQNTKLLTLTQEKAKMDARNKINTQDSEQTKIAFENKEITIKNLREKVEDMQNEIESKLTDIQNNNSQLDDLKAQMRSLIQECEALYGNYDEKKKIVSDMKNLSKTADVWSGNDAQQWPVDTWETNTSTPTSVLVRYRALYEFVARNADEISFQPGDIINIPTIQRGEPGWLAGEIRGHTGWFPESYVEPVDGVGVRETPSIEAFPEEIETKRLEGIAEVPEVNESISTSQVDKVITEITDIEYYIANYPYQSQEQGDLTFEAGDTITVVKKDGDWWTGKVGNNIGIFPSNYVQKVDVNSTPNTGVIPTEPPSNIDQEVSQINEQKMVEKPLDSSITSSAQSVKGKKPEIASVIAAYQATSTEQLSLQRGQLIMIRKKTDSGWWEGELQAKGRKRQVGWFPASYVKVLNSSGRTSGRTTPVSSTRMQQEVVIDKVVALFPYQASNPDELTFAKDDIISVTAREEEAWWRGELNGISGVFPSNYVAPLQQQSNKKRQDAIKELVNTEKVYVDDMLIVQEIFEIPLKTSSVIHKEEAEKIFGNWKSIYKCNKSFLDDLDEWYRNESDILGPIISKHLCHMKVYETFCAMQLESAAILQKHTETSMAFRDFMKKCQNHVATKGMPLSSFLIKPMQRITRYPLLIRKIIENTPNEHSDFEYLQLALKASEQLVNDINENVRGKEDQERYSWLQKCVQNDLNIVFNSETNQMGQRKLIHYGILTKVKSGKELVGFLFNDFLLLIQPSKSLGSHFTFQRNTNISFKMYKQPILIQDLSISRESTDHVEQGTDSNRVVKIYDNKNKYNLSFLSPTVNECNLWTNRIEKCKENFRNINKLKQTRPVTSEPHLGKFCGRLLVLVEKGHRFVSSGKPHSDNVYCKVCLGGQKQITALSKEQILNGNGPHNGASLPTVIWNHSMQFQLRNIESETVAFTVYGANLYSPDEFLGSTELKIYELMREAQSVNGPIVKKLVLRQVESGDIVVKFDLQMFN